MTEEQSCQGGWRCLCSPSRLEGSFSETSLYKVGAFVASRSPRLPCSRPPGLHWALARRRRCNKTLRAVATCYAMTAREFPPYCERGYPVEMLGTGRDNGQRRALPAPMTMPSTCKITHEPGGAKTWVEELIWTRFRSGCRTCPRWIYLSRRSKVG